MGNELSILAQATGMSHCIGPQDLSRKSEVVYGGNWQTQLPEEFRQVRKDLKVHTPAPAPVATRSSARMDRHAGGAPDENQSGRRRRMSEPTAAAAAQAAAQGLEVPWLGGGGGNRDGSEGQRTLAPREANLGPRNNQRQQAPNLETCTSNIAAAGSFQARKSGPLGAQAGAAMNRQSFAGQRSLESFAVALPESAAAGQQARQQRNPDGSIYMPLPTGLAPSTDPGLQTGASFVAMNTNPPGMGCNTQAQPAPGSNTRSSFTSCAANQGSMAHSRASFPTQLSGLQRIRE